MDNVSNQIHAPYFSAKCCYNCKLIDWSLIGIARPHYVSITVVSNWHNELEGVSNDQPLDCLLNRLFRRRSKETSRLCVSGLCEGNWPVIGEFPAQRASNAENASIHWRHNASPSPNLCTLVIKFSMIDKWAMVPQIRISLIDTIHQRVEQNYIYIWTRPLKVQWSVKYESIGRYYQISTRLGYIVVRFH